MRCVIGILSYNMPQLADELYNRLKLIVKVPVEYVIFDNGSDKNKISDCTTHRIENNSKLTGGMNSILAIAKEKNIDYLWLCTNDIELKTLNDPVKDMINIFENNESIGIIHPSLKKEPVSNYAYPWMCKDIVKKDDGFTTNHITYDIICPMFRKKFLDIFNWEFDKRFLYGWGIDWDNAYICRNHGYKIAVDFNIEVEHKTSITYDSGNDKEFKNRQEYYNKASENMNKIMIEKYGIDWKKILGIEN